MLHVWWFVVFEYRFGMNGGVGCGGGDGVTGDYGDVRGNVSRRC